MQNSQIDGNGAAIDPAVIHTREWPSAVLEKPLNDGMD